MEKGGATRGYKSKILYIERNSYGVQLSEWRLETAGRRMDVSARNSRAIGGEMHRPQHIHDSRLSRTPGGGLSRAFHRCWPATGGGATGVAARRRLAPNYHLPRPHTMNPKHALKWLAEMDAIWKAAVVTRG